MLGPPVPAPGGLCALSLASSPSSGVPCLGQVCPVDCAFRGNRALGTESGAVFSRGKTARCSAEIHGRLAVGSARQHHVVRLERDRLVPAGCVSRCYAGRGRQADRGGRRGGKAQGGARPELREKKGCEDHGPHHRAPRGDSPSSPLLVAISRCHSRELAALLAAAAPRLLLLCRPSPLALLLLLLLLLLSP
jgi:hypothetical protein